MMEIKTITSILLLAFIFTASCTKLPETKLQTPALLKFWGYPSETHEAHTKDGYILTLHRIPHGRKGKGADAGDKPRPVILLHHSLLCASSSWLLNLPHQSLGFILADAGFDVWMGNARGNTYSNKHVTLKTKSKAFWDFSIDEIAKYDLPATVDYVLNTTNVKQLYYIGHSQGSLMAFTGLSENKDLQKKIKMIFAIAPVTRIRHINYVFRTIASYNSYIRWWLKFFDVNEVFPTSDITKAFGNKFCYWMPKVCEKFLEVVSGFDKKNLNSTRMPVYFTHMPSGTSAKNMDHYFQMVNSKLLQKFDYGESENLKRYKHKIAPKYNVTKVDVPTVLLYGSQDSIVPPQDVEWTAQNLPNVIKKIEVSDYNHLDCILAPSAGERMHKHIVDMVQKKENN